MESSSPDDRYSNPSWVRKFKVAFRGVAIGFSTQSSFKVHLPVAVLVLLLSVWLRIELWQWCVLVGSIGCVLALELFNTGLESLSRAVTREENPWIRDALDVGSGAVLIASLTAALIGSMVLLPPLLRLLLTQ